MSGFVVRDFLDRRGTSLQLTLVAGEEGLDREIVTPDISSPGLVLSGYTERFPRGRMQVMGETEINYLRSRTPEERREILNTFLDFDVPCLFITKGLEPSAELLAVAAERSVPVMRTELKTAEFYRRVKPFLEGEFAPSTTVHGSLADVYGVGLLFVGKSGIGKSECVLDLVERGHRLVADDVVIVTQRGVDVLIGRGHELQKHHMEIRGIGIVDVRALFGIRATRQQKRIEVVVQLEAWSDAASYDRTGLERDTIDILGVTLPKVVIPLNPGKNITVLSEVVAMRHLLAYAGVNSAERFEERLKLHMRPIREYLEEDHE
ncbi:MAG: HPr(Ser) kinase/phosphatase [Gemmatimonadota bacterium]